MDVQQGHKHELKHEQLLMQAAQRANTLIER
jgi:hypothetical protein